MELGTEKVNAIGAKLTELKELIDTISGDLAAVDVNMQYPMPNGGPGSFGIRIATRDGSFRSIGGPLTSLVKGDQ